MNCYLDTSAVVKLWIEEENSQELRATVDSAVALGSSTVTHAEFGATLARLEREGRLSPADRVAILADFVAQSGTMHRVVAGARLSELASEMAHTHALRRFDAIHLASAMQFRRVVAPVVFLCFDVRLNAAARAEGFDLPAWGLARGAELGRSG